jgi:putative pyruvate formate lyase activating enzyme
VDKVATYRRLFPAGELRRRATKAREMMESCCLCPRHCGAHRLSGETGQCRTEDGAIVSSYGPHFGEEAPLVGRGGSGTIFFTSCNLHCVFCQNHTISQLGEGHPATSRELARMMLHLQARGCHNINLVSPSHVIPFILDALDLAAGEGLRLPLVYNTGGYDSLEALHLLEAVVDIYMPDMKYADGKTAKQLSGVKDYPEVNQAAVKEMHRQVGDLRVNQDGIAERGLLVRHLVLPHRLAGTERIARFIAREVSTNTYLNVMAQYRPSYRAHGIPQLSRPLTAGEFREAVGLARRYGLTRLNKDYATLPSASF